jgi:ABC-type uncharacterized transport system fused permease/ATPase subunit
MFYTLIFSTGRIARENLNQRKAIKWFDSQKYHTVNVLIEQYMMKNTEARVDSAVNTQAHGNFYPLPNHLFAVVCKI